MPLQPKRSSERCSSLPWQKREEPEPDGLRSSRQGRTRRARTTRLETTSCEPGCCCWITDASSTATTRT